jgi:hypothetical protein
LAHDLRQRITSMKQSILLAFILMALASVMADAHTKNAAPPTGDNAATKEIPVRSDCPVKCTSGPGQLKMSDGVTACITLASAGGVDGSFFTAKRALP